MPDEKKEHIEYQRNFFDENVEVFKHPIPEHVERRSREIVSAIVKHDSIRLLDVGTGTGAFLGHYHEVGVPFENMVACDLSSQMLAEAQKRFPKVSFWQGDVLELAEDFGTFDLIVFNACFGNIFDQMAVLRKSHSLLNENGRIAISHPMGNACVKLLQERIPDLVMTLLPERNVMLNWAKELEMNMGIFRDESDLYLALLERTR